MKLYHFISSAHALTTYDEGVVKLSQFDKLNDSYELAGVDVRNRRMRNLIRETKKSISDETLLLCCCKDWRNPVMWSHYAERHSGAVVEFEINSSVYNVVAVDYCADLALVDVEAFGIANTEFQGALLKTKYIDWKYEQEIRVLIDSDRGFVKNGLRFMSLNENFKIRRIMFGHASKVSEHDIRRLRASTSEVIFEWTRLAFGKYGVVRDKSKKCVVVAAKL